MLRGLASRCTGWSQRRLLHTTRRATVMGRPALVRSALACGSSRSSTQPFQASLPVSQSVRAYNVHEHEAQELMDKFGVAVAKGGVARTAKDAKRIAEKMTGVQDYVVKAQVLAGGRGKGTFMNGFQGGVKVCSSVEEVETYSAAMIGQRLVTAQTGDAGRPCNKVFITERLFLRKESYLAILMDRESGGPVMVGSPQGGMDIEGVAATTPEAIHKIPIDIQKGLQAADAERMAELIDMGNDGEKEQVVKIISGLYELFHEKDATLIEVNPLGENHDGTIFCLDAKINFDDNAAFRNKDIASMRDKSQEDPREVEAEESNLNYIGLDGNIGCLVNGAGLAMATMDAIKYYGGDPANFLDLGGGATVEQVTAAFRLLNADDKVEAILVNIFGGIMRCDTIALGIIKAAQSLGIGKPIVIRLAGTNVEQAQALIDDSGMRMLTSEDLGEAAERAVRVAQIAKLAKQAQVTVSFEMPL